jgi:fructose-1,6-bisphosphatase/inositol monophosphatase family enzyme
VRNLGKEDSEETLHEGSDLVKRRAQAKTRIDEEVQEMLLQSVVQGFGEGCTNLDAEEDTPTRKLFPETGRAQTIVIDPIDGTLEYLEGRDDYSVCVGLVSRGRVEVACVYFPLRAKLYLLNADRHAYVCVCDTTSIIGTQLMARPEASPARRVYANSRVTNETIARLERYGRVVKDTDGEVSWPNALIGCMEGVYDAAFFVRPQIRDVFLGAMIAAMDSGYAYDFSGVPLIWPERGRIPNVVFGFGAPMREELLACINRALSETQL